MIFVPVVSVLTVTTWNVTSTEPLAGTPAPIVHVISPFDATLTLHVGVVDEDSDPQLGDPFTSVVFGGAASKICSVPDDGVPAGLVYRAVRV